MPDNDGSSRTPCKLMNPMINANQEYLFENTPIEKMDAFDLELNPCTNRARHKVANAIVLAVSGSPDSNPVRKAIIVEVAIKRPSTTIRAVNVFVNNCVWMFLGLSLIAFGLCGSNPIAIAGRLSVSRLINKR